MPENYFFADVKKPTFEKLALKKISKEGK